LAKAVRDKACEKKSETKLQFVISGLQIDKLTSWLNKHDKKCRFAKPGNCGAIGGRLQYSFVPTSIGEVIKVTCACGKEVDLSDYEDW